MPLKKQQRTILIKFLEFDYLFVFKFLKTLRKYYPMKKEFSKFKLQNEAIKGNTRIFLGHIEEEPIIIKATVPTVNKDIAFKLINEEHKDVSQNDIYYTSTIVMDTETNVEIVYPVTPQEMANLAFSFQSFKESYEEYQNLSISPSWIDKYLEDGSHERFKVVQDFKDFTILRSESSSFSIEWKCVFKNPAIRSIRDLNSVEILEKAKNTIYELLTNLNVPHDSVCLYFCYNHKKSRLCLNINTILRSFFNFNFNGRFFYLDEIIKNIKHDPLYFQKDMLLIRNREFKE